MAKPTRSSAREPAARVPVGGQPANLPSQPDGQPAPLEAPLPLDGLQDVLSVEELRELQTAVREIYVDTTVTDYIVRLVNATRNHPDVYLGASPRGSLALYRAGQAFAALSGRDYVIPDDVKRLAEPGLAHRLIIKTSSSIHDVNAAHVVHELLESVPVEAPRGTDRPAARPPTAAAATARQTGSA